MKKQWQLSDYDHEFEKHIEITLQLETLQVTIEQSVEINEDYLDDEDEEDDLENRETKEDLYFSGINDLKTFLTGLIDILLQGCFISYVKDTRGVTVGEDSDLSRQNLHAFFEGIDSTKQYSPSNGADPIHASKIEESIEKIAEWF
ncbi:MAG: hypothetical protein HKM93_09005 [Desulfobacteraceae bacterium]|nr:hypothetical protein [Desulfobacteraceae bacterium]